MAVPAAEVARDDALVSALEELEGLIALKESMADAMRQASAPQCRQRLAAVVAPMVMRACVCRQPNYR
jgi:hypothetical protein